MQLFQIIIEEPGRVSLTMEPAPIRTTISIAAENLEHLVQSFRKSSMLYMASDCLARNIDESKVIQIQRQGPVLIAPKAAARA